MSKAWTPGPWTFSRELKALDVHPVADTGGYNDADICVLNPEGRHGDGAEEIPFANAHLIAAAPELYDILDIIIRDEYVGHRIGCPASLTDRRYVRGEKAPAQDAPCDLCSALAALAKARGE